MKETMPRTPFSTPLSGSARETERRLSHIFAGPQKRPPLLLIVLVSAVCLLCVDLVSCQVAEPEGPPAAELWLDYTGLQELPWDDIAERELPEYPGVTFRWMANQVSAVEDGQERILFSGMPVESVYLWDLTGDGLRELCSVTACGSGMVDERVVAYDYAAGEVYMLRSRGMFDYGLSLEDGQLQAIRYRYAGGPPPSGQPLSVGHLAIDEGTILLEGEAEFNALRLVDEVSLPTDDPDFAWLLMREHDGYPYDGEYMFSRTLLTQEGDGCVLALALVVGSTHPEGNGNLMLGLWDTEAAAWRGPVYTVGGDDGLFSSWPAEDGSLHLLCANTVTWTGYETFSEAVHYRFDGRALEELGRWDSLDLGNEVKLVPGQGGFEVFVRDPQQVGQPDIAAGSGEEVWLYSRFEPVTE